LLISFTASYAASKKLPIITGCFFEWRLADNSIYNEELEGHES
jgi:hypothetical protein